MTITKSYNKHTDTYYAYDTTWVWDEERNCKVQKRRCIGKYDPITDKITPNGKRGRPLGVVQAKSPSVSGSAPDLSSSVAKLEELNQPLYDGLELIAARFDSIEQTLSALAQEFHAASADLKKLLAAAKSK